MTAITPRIFCAPTAYAPMGDDFATRRSGGRRRAFMQAGEGASLVRVQQHLPLAVGASFSVSNGLLFPIAGAAIGALLLGFPGAILGGVAGWMLARR
ncbi:MAG: hypothetical protein JWO69_1804 [Thermoleophilia bacterium]|nr:hypothetical protein [Thermoleophilia bacterium]